MNSNFLCKTHSATPLWLPLVLLVTTLPLISPADDELSEGRKKNLHKVAQLEQERRTSSAGKEHLFVRRGLLADKETRTVTIDAEATGLSANTVVEFPLIAEHSAHDYEALFISFARPSHLREALEFIGVPAGRPVNFRKHVFWPKGERVNMLVTWADQDPVHVEDLIIDVRQPGKPTLPRIGFIHSGSVFIEREGRKILAADEDGPGAIAASYNEPTTLLDMPRQSLQGEVYERYVANPETLIPEETFVTITLVPEKRPADLPQRVLNLTLTALAPEGSTDLGTARFALSPTPSPPSPTPPQHAVETLPEILKICRQHLPAQDPYITLNLDSSLNLTTAADLARVLETLDHEEGLRLEPPLEGQLYYKAFLPQEAWRDRKNRPTQPCELRFEKKDGTTAVTLLRIEEIWNEKPDDWRPTLKLHETPLTDPQDLPAAIAQEADNLPVLLVFAPGEMTLAEIMPYLSQVTTSHPNQHIFIEKQ